MKGGKEGGRVEGRKGGEREGGRVEGRREEGREGGRHWKEEGRKVPVSGK